MDEEPTLKLLQFIRYTDHKGNDRTYRFIQKFKNHCTQLGTYLDIEKETLDSFSKSNKTPEEICGEILDIWMKRGESSYEVTWGGLLMALEDAQHGGVAKNLEQALRLHFGSI